MLKRLSLGLHHHDQRRRLAFGAACLVATLAVAQLIAPPETKSATQTFTVAADTYVSECNPDAAHGDSPILRVDGGQRERSSYLRFDISGTRNNVTKATLRVFSLKANRLGVAVRIVGDDNWSERDLTFNTAPVVGAYVGHSAEVGDHKWTDIDVTDVLQHEASLTDGGKLTLALTTSRYALIGASTPDESLEAASVFASRVSDNAPQLKVETAAVPTASSSTSAPTTTAPPATTTPSTSPPPTSPPPTTPPPVSGAHYVDSAGGNDGNSGTSPGSAWRTLGRVGAAALGAGDHVLLKRGATWGGEALVISRSGSPSNPLTIGAYGSGPLPLIQRGGCVELRGNAIVLREVQVDNCAWAGVNIYGAGDRVEASAITHNVAGVFARPGSTGATVTGNDIRDNNRMSVLTPGGDDDSGAFGVLLQGTGTEVSFNTISGHDAFSYDYGRDGAAVEVYGATGSNVHHNVALNNDAFSELGKNTSADNTYAYNVVRGSTPNGIGIVTRGSGSGYGPVRNTRLFNNSILLTGGNSQGFVCHGGCGPSILTMRNNIVQAVAKAGYADAPFDEDYNLYFGGQTQFARGPHSFVANPLFVSSADLHLQAGSPAINRGVPTGYAQDLDRRPVPQGSAPDLGAYERA
jgi:hypothetical protein